MGLLIPARPDEIDTSGPVREDGQSLFYDGLERRGLKKVGLVGPKNLQHGDAMQVMLLYCQFIGCWTGFTRYDIMAFSRGLRIEAIWGMIQGGARIGLIAETGRLIEHTPIMKLENGEIEGYYGTGLKGMDQAIEFFFTRFAIDLFADIWHK